MNTSKWIGLIIIITTIFVVIYITRCQNECPEPISYNVEVVQDEYGVWRVEDSNGYDRGSIVLNRSDVINWQSMESDVYFAFPENIDDYFRYDQNLFAEMSREEISRLMAPEPALAYDDTTRMVFVEKFSGKRTSYVERGESLRLTVSDDAPADTIKYEVFVVIGDTLVEGNSPPNLIIR